MYCYKYHTDLDDRTINEIIHFNAYNYMLFHLLKYF